MSPINPNDRPSLRAANGERVPEGRVRGTLRNADRLRGPFAAFAPHPALRATFSPLRGEKEYLIDPLLIATQLPVMSCEENRVMSSIQHGLNSVKLCTNSGHPQHESF
jgi:hypothetical protein